MYREVLTSPHGFNLIFLQFSIGLFIKPENPPPFVRIVGGSKTKTIKIIYHTLTPFYVLEQRDFINWNLKM